MRRALESSGQKDQANRKERTSWWRGKTEHDTETSSKKKASVCRHHIHRKPLAQALRKASAACGASSTTLTEAAVSLLCKVTVLPVN